MERLVEPLHKMGGAQAVPFPPVEMMATQGVLKDELVFATLVMPCSKHAIMVSTNDSARLLGNVET
eukprot:scaffold147562_cov42-Attheya_sp.AAC.3